MIKNEPYASFRVEGWQPFDLIKACPHLDMDERPVIARERCVDCDREHEADATLGAAVKRAIPGDSRLRDWQIVRSWADYLEGVHGKIAEVEFLWNVAQFLEEDDDAVQTV